MNSQQNDIEAIFNAALIKSTNTERTSYLDEFCGTNTPVRIRVEALLEAHGKAGDFLDAPVFESGTELEPLSVTEVPGTVIGRYKLLEKIGEGGMATVYMAEQEQPIRRQVALKIIKLGMDTKQVIARFELERQALALMDHPNIAKVHDAGSTETGRPYFVMELVKGLPITKYCDENNLTTRERLDLFIQVCQAVQHAHQKGIIHRDIKPTNVLVTLHDGKPVPKIIDFGIAKAVKQKLTEKTVFTQYAQLIGTPEYMSPEQAEMSGLDVDTRTDIYSLGVLLYELLTGTTPFEDKKLREAGYAEIQRIICEEEPTKPSTKLSTLGEELTDIAKHRHTEPGILQKLVRGDLDWIVMKTLEKDRTRRYAATTELAADIERFLQHEPVQAAAPSLFYKLRKFVWRNRVAVMTTAAVAAVIVIGFIVSTIMYFQAKQAKTEAERSAKIAQAVNVFLNKDLLASIKPEKAQGREITVKEVLDAASEKIEGKFKDEPLIEASIRDTLGSTYLSLGKYEAAEPHLERTRDIAREQLGEEHPTTLESMNKLAVLYEAQGRYEEAEPLYVKTLEIQRRVLGEEHPSTLSSIVTLAMLYKSQGRYKEAEPLILKTLEIQRRVLGEEHPDTLSSMNFLAVMYENQGCYEEAESLYVKTLEIRRRVLGEEHPRTLISMSNLAVFYENQGRYDEAEPLHVKTLEIRRRVLGEEHPDTLGSMNNLAMLYRTQNRYDEAETLYVKTLEIMQRALDEGHPFKLNTMNNLAVLYNAQSRYEEAESLHVKTLEIRQRVLGEEHPDTLQSINNLALLYKNWAKNLNEQRDKNVKSKAIEKATKACELTNWKKAMYIDTLAAAYTEVGDFEAAVKWQKKAIDLLTEGEAAKWRDGFEERLRLYQSGQPYREESP